MAGLEPEKYLITKHKGIILSDEDYDLIMFCRNELPFGSCTLITHNGKPVRVENPKSIKVFGEKEKKNTKSP